VYLYLEEASLTQRREASTSYSSLPVPVPGQARPGGGYSTLGIVWYSTAAGYVLHLYVPYGRTLPVLLLCPLWILFTPPIRDRTFHSGMNFVVRPDPTSIIRQQHPIIRSTITTDLQSADGRATHVMRSREFVPPRRLTSH
jgi:hypothetical protein